MAQLNINDLYETARKKELNKFKTFDTILKRCHNKIKNYASNHKTECIYEVPEFIIGTPLFDRDELTEYISLLSSCPSCGSRFLARNDLVLSIVNIFTGLFKKRN